MAKSMLTDKKKTYTLLLAHLGAFFTVASWGSSFLSTKVIMADGGVTPVEMYIYRFTLAYFILFLFTFKRILANNWGDELRFLVCGLCAGSLYFITENYALKYTSTGNVSLLAAVSPLFTTILMSVVYKIRLLPGVIIGSIIAFIGVGCIIFSHGEGFVIKPKGDILALTASLSWAIYTLTVKRLIPLYNSFFVTRKLFFYGVITALPLLILQKEPLHLDVLFNFSHPEIPLNFIFLVLFCSLGAYLVWNEAMKELGAVTANNYLYLQPLVTMIAAFFILHEDIYFLGYVGCILILGGLVISDKMKWDYRKIEK
ncbi:MAG: DMT family transporter [Muribaculaceae bacterium]|nr:DMT family transporter [Muribaculaceae bacterium]MDE6794199.1 DMT family transporter [Muribaculaceae bacterium]